MLHRKDAFPHVVRYFYILMSLIAAPIPAVQAQPGDPPPPDEPPLYGPGDDAPTFYLAPWGDPSITWETNTEATPFITLDQARREIQRYKSGLSTPTPIQVQIAGGVYPMKEPVVFQEDDSGWPQDPTTHQILRIQYAQFPLIDPRTGLTSGTEALFSGGGAVTAWSPVTITTNGHSVSAYVAKAPDWLTAGPNDVRDLWVNNQRMVRARFPNVPTATATYAHPWLAPLPSTGYLMVNNVSLPSSGSQRRQQITVRNPSASSPTDPTVMGDAIPVPLNWAQVEVNATRAYINAQQPLGVNGTASAVPTRPDEYILSFAVTAFGSGPTEQDLGGLGPFYYDNWTPTTDPNHRTSTLRGYLQVTGEQNVVSTPPHTEPRTLPAQVFLSNDLAFLDADKEWYYDSVNKLIYLKIAQDPNTCDVEAPLAQQLLILQDASHLDFYGLEWAYTYQPLPRLVDGVTPGYVDVQTGLEWNDSAVYYENNIPLGAVTMEGAQDCIFRHSRVAHTGGSGVIIGTVALPNIPYFVESNNCIVQTCEVFDIGAHGVYVGDEFTAHDPAWEHTQSQATTDASNGNVVNTCRIENYSVIYRDSAGVYAGHTRDLYVGNCEVSYGNYDGMSIGTYQAHHLDPMQLPGPCTFQFTEEPPPYPTYNFPPSGYPLHPTPPSSEGTRLVLNNIHHVMLRLTDGGGIYTPGSHISSTATGIMSQIWGNYIHDIVLNPYMNAYPIGPYSYGDQLCKALYFEAGCDSWKVYNNYVERTQAPLSMGTQDYSSCVYAPSILHCGDTSSDTIAWWRSVWPSPWYPCAGSAHAMPGLNWDPNSPNYWLNVSTTEPNTTGPYGAYSDCYGYGWTCQPWVCSNPSYTPGGMRDLTGPNLSNVLVSDASSTPVQTIITNAGVHNSWFDSEGWRVHRKPINGGPTDPASQVQ